MSVSYISIELRENISTGIYTLTLILYFDFEMHTNDTFACVHLINTFSNFNAGASSEFPTIFICTCTL